MPALSTLIDKFLRRQSLSSGEKTTLCNDLGAARKIVDFVSINSTSSMQLSPDWVDKHILTEDPVSEITVPHHDDVAFETGSVITFTALEADVSISGEEGVTIVSPTETRTVAGNRTAQLLRLPTANHWLFIG